MAACPPACLGLVEAGAPVDERQIARAAPARLVGLRLVDLEGGGVEHDAVVVARPAGATSVFSIRVASSARSQSTRTSRITPAPPRWKPGPPESGRTA